MAAFDNNIWDIVVDEANIRSLENNRARFTSTCRYCHITNCSSNNGHISVAPSSLVDIIRSNTGSILLMDETKVSLIDNNCGTITLMNGCRADSVERNTGHITLSEGSSTGLLDRNSGIAIVKNYSNIWKIRDNVGTITIQDNCTAGSIEGNSGMITLGNNCVVKSVTGSSGYLRWGSGCTIPQDTNQGSGSNFFPPPAGPAFPLYSYGASTVNDVIQTFSLVQPFQFLMPSVQSYGYSANGYNVNNGTQAFPQPMSQTVPNQSSSAPQNPPNTEEDETQSEDLLCAICMVGKKDVAFNCGHTCCATCANTLIYCHMCRRTIVQKIKIFL